MVLSVGVLGTPKADVPVAPTRVAGEAVAEIAGESVRVYIEHVVAATGYAPARGVRVLPAVVGVVGIRLDQAAGPLGLVSRKVEYALGRRPLRMAAHGIGLATPTRATAIAL